MTITCGDCGWKAELPEGFFGCAYEFWQQHGHHPGVLIYTCCCGETYVSGPKVTPVAEWPLAPYKDYLFYALHQLCEGAGEPQQVDAGQPYRDS